MSTEVGVFARVKEGQLAAADAHLAKFDFGRDEFDNVVDSVYRWYRPYSDSRRIVNFGEILTQIENDSIFEGKIEILQTHCEGV